MRILDRFWQIFYDGNPDRIMLRVHPGIFPLSSISALQSLRSEPNPIAEKKSIIRLQGKLRFA